MAIKLLPVSDQSGQEMYLTNICVPGLRCTFVSTHYQPKQFQGHTILKYYTRRPSQLTHCATALLHTHRLYVSLGVTIVCKFRGHDCM